MENQTNPPPVIGKCDSKVLTEQLKNAVSLVASEDRIVWTIFGVFLASQGVLIGCFFRNGEFIGHAPAGLFLSLFGLVLSVIWLFIQWRALGHLNRYDDLVRRLEVELKISSEFCISTWNNPAARKEFLSGPSVRKIMPATCATFIGIWLLSSVGWFGYVCFTALRWLQTSHCGC